MIRPSKTIWLGLALPLVILLLPGSGWTCSAGPPDGMANDPPANENCTQCHSTYGLNQGTGTLELIGLPQAYTPEMTYQLTVTLTDIGQIRWGFELTSILENGDQGGELNFVDTNVQLSQGPGTARDYLKQTSAGSFPGQIGSATWDIEWTAPGVGQGEVGFFMTGNGANNNGSTTGDFIYAVNYVVTEGQVGVHPETGLQPVTHLLVETYPNPFNPATELSFSLPASADVRLEVFDTSGDLVTTLVDDFRTAGVHTASFDASGLASGLYLYRLSAGDLNAAGKLVLLK
jgi:hypothetical protein